MAADALARLLLRRMNHATQIRMRAPTDAPTPMAAFVPTLISFGSFGGSGGGGSSCSSLLLTSGVGAEPEGALVGAAVMNGAEAVVVVAVVVAL